MSMGSHRRFLSVEVTYKWWLADGNVMFGAG